MSENAQTRTQYDTQPAGLEKWLDQQSKASPLQLPADAKKWIADNAWWIALIGGLLSAGGALAFWQVAHAADELVRVYGVLTGTTSLGFMWYVLLIVMAASAALMLLAVSPLKNHRKMGWNLLYYNMMLNLVVGILYLFVSGYGAANLIGSVIGVAIGWFFLFQVRSQFARK
jgi:hypothetical protein